MKQNKSDQTCKMKQNKSSECSTTFESIQPYPCCVTSCAQIMLTKPLLQTHPMCQYCFPLQSYMRTKLSMYTWLHLVSLLGQRFDERLMKNLCLTNSRFNYTLLHEKTYVRVCMHVCVCVSN